MPIKFDLDGIIRDLCLYIGGGFPDNWHDPLPNGVKLMEHIKADLSLLFSAPTTEYYPVIRELQRVDIITCQPESWRPYTMAWITKHFNFFSTDVQFVNDAEEKLALLKEGDLLVEDYPFFNDYSKIILIDYPYNRNVTGEVARVKNPDELRALLC